MLHFILGRANAPKTEYIRNLLTEKILGGQNGFVMLVPEQFSFDTERAMLEKLGAGRMQNIEIVSFSRLADRLLTQNGKIDRPRLNDGTRAVLMSLALEALQDHLDIFKKYVGRPALIEKLLSFTGELKQCAVSPEQLAEAGEAMDSGTLKTKLSELSKVTALYTAMVARSFFDETDALTALAGLLCEVDYFKGKTVAIDAFKGFTKQERDVIEKILRQADDVYITLCTTDIHAAEGFSVFENITEEAVRLRRIAAQNNVSVATPVCIEKDEKLRPADLNFLEETIFSGDARTYEDAPSSVTVCAAGNTAQACDYIACTAKKLLRENGYRCRDIAVIERSADSFDKELAAAFQKYGVPCYHDDRQPITAQPLMIFVRTLLEIAECGISTDALFRLLKTGLFVLSDHETAELENYAALWQITAAKWKIPFTGNPNGFGCEMTEQSETELSHLNALREKAVSPLLQFRKQFAEGTGNARSEAVYRFLIRNEVPERLKTLALELSETEGEALYAEQNRIWEALMQMLNELALAAENISLTAARYRELFEILLSTKDLGSIPQGLDEVTVGNAERMRADARRAVFIIGANDGVFPLNPSTEGLLNDKERKILKECGIELAATAEYKSVDERFIAYNALSGATEKLFVVYMLAAYTGEAMFKSEIITELTRVFPKLQIENPATADPLQKVESAFSAFELLALKYGEDSELSASLKAYFAASEEYKGRAEAVKRAAERGQMQIENPEIAEKLFGKSMYLSASRAELYHKCPFRYFCQFGVKAQPRKTAELDAAQSGTVIHYVLEQLFTNYTPEKLSALQKNEVKAVIESLLQTYMDEKMGGTDDKPERFLFLYNRLCEVLCEVVERICEDFLSGDFRPSAFELSIDRDGAVAPYTLELPDGGTLSLRGSVDRVDIMEKGGKTYLRVVDYKSGGKDFVLSDVFSGLNMQMLIYLFALKENGEKLYPNIVPSGVLYLPAKQAGGTLDRHATEGEIKAETIKATRMNGLVLAEPEVILGMESDGKGIHIPAKIDESGKMTGSLINAGELGRLQARIDKILCEMASALKSGKIPVLPAVGTDYKDVCSYCDYASVCGFEVGREVKQIEKLRFAESLRALNQTEGEGKNG